MTPPRPDAVGRVVEALRWARVFVDEPSIVGIKVNGKVKHRPWVLEKIDGALAHLDAEPGEDERGFGHRKDCPATTGHRCDCGIFHFDERWPDEKRKAQDEIRRSERITGADLATRVGAEPADDGFETWWSELHSSTRFYAKDGNWKEVARRAWRAALTKGPR